jgi:hypothetical protein
MDSLVPSAAAHRTDLGRPSCTTHRHAELFSVAERQILDPECVCQLTSKGGDMEIKRDEERLMVMSRGGRRLWMMSRTPNAAILGPHDYPSFKYHPSPESGLATPGCLLAFGFVHRAPVGDARPHAYENMQQYT